MYLKAKSVLILLGWTAAASSATDTVAHKKMFRSVRPSDLASRVTTLMTSNEEINDIMKTDKSIEEFSLLIKSNSETIKNGATKKKKERKISGNVIKQ